MAVPIAGPGGFQKPEPKNVRCVGLGSLLSSVACASVHRGSIRIEAGCGWFSADTSRQCTTLFNCYLPEYPDSAVRVRNATFEDVAKRTKLLFDGTVRSRTNPPRPCVAVHVRRGDACLNPDRGCASYDSYLHAIESQMSAFFPASGQMNWQKEEPFVYVMTDAHDFPFANWSRYFPLRYQTVDREGFRVEGASSSSRPRSGPAARTDRHHRIRLEPNRSSFPENRLAELGERPVAEVLHDIEQARRCSSFVGAFSSGLARVVYALMSADQGRRAPFIDVEGGCIEQVQHCHWSARLACSFSGAHG